MLAGQMSNQDEDEVEDELDALEAEVTGVAKMPDAPKIIPEGAEEVEVKQDSAKERARRRAKEQQAPEPLLA